MQVLLYSLMEPKFAEYVDTDFWDLSLETLQWVDAIRFEAPVTESLAYFVKWLEHRPMSFAEYCRFNRSSKTLTGISIGFNMLAGFEEEPVALLLHRNRGQPVLVAYLHRLAPGIVATIDALAGSQPTYFVATGEPEASVLAAYLRLTGHERINPRDRPDDHWHIYRGEEEA